VGARYSPKLSRSAKPHSPVVTPALAQATEAGMTLRFSRAAARSSLSAAATAFGSRAARHAVRRSICSASACGETVTIISAEPASGEGSLSTKRLTPTTVCSPRSIASMRRVFDSTSCCFM
jgi:hypothetical protein